MVHWCRGMKHNRLFQMFVNDHQESAVQNTVSCVVVVHLPCYGDYNSLVFFNTTRKSDKTLGCGDWLIKFPCYLTSLTTKPCWCKHENLSEPLEIYTPGHSWSACLTFQAFIIHYGNGLTCTVLQTFQYTNMGRQLFPTRRHEAEKLSGYGASANGLSRKSLQ